MQCWTSHWLLVLQLPLAPELVQLPVLGQSVEGVEQLVVEELLQTFPQVAP